MPKLLAILSSPRGAESYSNILTHTFIDTYTKANPGTEVILRDLYASSLPFVDTPWINASYTPPDKLTPDQKQVLALSDTLIAELKAADEIVIGAPMYNFSIPAILKAWVDHIVRLNQTFSPAYEGLVANKKVTVMIASGGVYTPGSFLAGYNVESTYLQSILAFIGIKDVHFVLAGGVGDIARGNTTQEAYLAEFKPQAEAAAKP